MKSNHLLKAVKQCKSLYLFVNQILVCLLLLTNSCNSKPKNHWKCDDPLPEEFKIVQSKSGDKFAIQYGRSQRRVDSYEEKKERYEYTYYYLGENENGWVVQVPLGSERLFDDSCSAKDFFALYNEQEDVLKIRYKEKQEFDSLDKLYHSY